MYATATPLKDTPDTQPPEVHETNTSYYSPSPFIKEHSVFFNTASRRSTFELSREYHNQQNLTNIKTNLSSQQQSSPSNDAIVLSSDLVSSPAVLAGMGLLYHHQRKNNYYTVTGNNNNTVSSLQQQLSRTTRENDRLRAAMKAAQMEKDRLAIQAEVDLNKAKSENTRLHERIEVL